MAYDRQTDRQTDPLLDSTTIMADQQLHSSRYCSLVLSTVSIYLIPQKNTMPFKCHVIPPLMMH